MVRTLDEHLQYNDSLLVEKDKLIIELKNTITTEQPSEEETQLQKDNQELKAQVEELQAELKKKDDQPSDKIISGKSETAYLNLIHALKETCLSNETFENQEKLIKDLSEMYTGYTGLSESNLRDKFSKSKDLK
ncbi:hypothetical protein [Phocoenobacter skyensis]|nr:hypothetical protein [Pasteurella skyensis]MDP8185416.1 hypothetical protein [Pasteurella skyensis]